MDSLAINRRSPLLTTEKFNQLFIQIFFFLLFIDLTFTPISMMLGYITKIEIIFHFFKIPKIGILLIAVLYHIKNGFKLNLISKIFLLYSPLVITYGLVMNPLSKASFSHFYTLFMPIIMMSFGTHIQIKIEHFNSLKHKFASLFRKSLFILSFAIPFYFLLNKLGIITYFGLSTFLTLFVAYFASQKDIKKTIWTMILIFLTGKRADLLGAVLILIFWFSRQYLFHKKLFNLKNLAYMTILVSILSSIAVFFFKQGTLDRFKPVLEMKLSDERSLYMGTGGRSDEIYTLVKKINENPIHWIIGSGVGATYIQKPFFKTQEYFELKKHYSHFSPLGYIFVFGLIFTMILYALFISYFLKGYFIPVNFYNLAFTGYFFLSFLGAIPFVDVLFWLILGANIGQILHYSKK